MYINFINAIKKVPIVNLKEYINKAKTSSIKLEIAKNIYDIYKLQLGETEKYSKNMALRHIR